MVKRFICISLIVFLILACSGCGIKNHTKDEEDFVSITVAVRKGEKTLWEGMVEDFYLENPKINVNFIEIGSEFEQYRLLTSALSTGESAFDVMEIEDVWVEEFIDSEYVYPLNKELNLEKGDISFAKTAFSREGVQYGVPFQMDIGMILASKQYEWDGSLYSLKVNDKSDEAVSADSAEKNDIISTLMELIKYTGNDVKAALELYKDIYANEARGVEALKKFGNGDLPVVRVWSSVLPKFRDEKHNVSGNFRTHNMPVGKNGNEISVAKIYALAISTLTEKKEACEAFIKFCDSYDFQVQWTKKTGTYPVRKAIYEEAPIKSEWNHITPMKDKIESVQIRPHVLRYAEKTDVIQKNVELYLTGEIAIDEVSFQLEEFLKNNM